MARRYIQCSAMQYKFRLLTVMIRFQTVKSATFEINWILVIYGWYLTRFKLIHCNPLRQIRILSYKVCSVGVVIGLGYWWHEESITLDWQVISYRSCCPWNLAGSAYPYPYLSNMNKIVFQLSPRRTMLPHIDLIYSTRYDRYEIAYTKHSEFKIKFLRIFSFWNNTFSDILLVDYFSIRMENILIFPNYYSQIWTKCDKLITEKK